jgi:hypothetical protein
MTPAKQGLTVRLNGTRQMGPELRPVDRDTFQFGNFTMRFVRDNAGKAVAMDFHSPVFRNVRFTRAPGSRSVGRANRPRMTGEGRQHYVSPGPNSDSPSHR